jgi:hypothetical protein
MSGAGGGSGIGSRPRTRAPLGGDEGADGQAGAEVSGETPAGGRRRRQAWPQAAGAAAAGQALDQASPQEQPSLLARAPAPQQRGSQHARSNAKRRRLSDPAGAVDPGPTQPRRGPRHAAQEPAPQPQAAPERPRQPAPYSSGGGLLANILAAFTRKG